MLSVGCRSWSSTWRLSWIPDFTFRNFTVLVCSDFNNRLHRRRSFQELNLHSPRRAGEPCPTYIRQAKSDLLAEISFIYHRSSYPSRPSSIQVCDHDPLRVASGNKTSSPRVLIPIHQAARFGNIPISSLSRPVLQQPVIFGQNQVIGF